jgi:hypothetical protein
MSTDVRSFSRAIMADIPDAVQQHVEEVAKHVADAIRYLSVHPFEFAIAVATAGIFIFAWVLARSTKRLWLATKEASAIQSRDLQASIAVAQEAANAAAKSAAASARAVVDIQRALIVPTQFHSTAIVRNDRVIAYRIAAVFENTGSTVATRALPISLCGRDRCPRISNIQIGWKRSRQTLSWLRDSKFLSRWISLFRTCSIS